MFLQNHSIIKFLPNIWPSKSYQSHQTKPRGELWYSSCLNWHHWHRWDSDLKYKYKYKTHTNTKIDIDINANTNINITLTQNKAVDTWTFDFLLQSFSLWISVVWRGWKLLLVNHENTLDWKYENFQSNSLSTQAAANSSSRTGSQESSARADFLGDHLYLYLYLYMSAWERRRIIGIWQTLFYAKCILGGVWLRYESSTLIIFKELSSSIFQSLWVSE